MPTITRKTQLDAEELTPLEHQVVELFNGLGDQSNPLMNHMRDKYANVLLKVAYTMYVQMPESRWPAEIKEPRYPDIRDLFLLGVALGYSLRAEEKQRK